MAFYNVYIRLAIVAALFVVGIYGAPTKYDPTWESLDSRPLPNWYVYYTPKIYVFRFFIKILVIGYNKHKINFFVY